MREVEGREVRERGGRREGGSEGERVREGRDGGGGRGE